MVERVIYKQKAAGTKNSGTSSPVASNIWLPGGATGNFATTLNTMIYQIWCRTLPVTKSITFNARYNVTTFQASNTLRIGIYTINPTTFAPKDLIVDGGTASNASTGEKTISLTVINLPVHFYVACVSQGGVGANITSGTGTQAWFHTFYGRSITISDATSNACYSETGITGALPSVATPVQGPVGTTPGIILEIP